MGVMVLVTITTKSKDEQRIAKEHSLFSQATAMRCATRAWPDVLRRSVTCRRGGAAAMYMSPNCLKDLPDHVSAVQGCASAVFQFDAAELCLCFELLRDTGIDLNVTQLDAEKRKPLRNVGSWYDAAGSRHLGTRK